MNNKEENQHENKQCFVIMPISDPKDYDSGHFKCVYEDIFIPAIKDAGYIPKRADDDKSSSMIQVSIIKDIIESPMAVCDLSTRNPNVLFELGIRQAFDLPVVLVQETDTPRIFDISTINTIDYRKNLTYREVMEDREKIKNAILETKDNTKGVNSIVRLLGVESAKKKDNMDESTMLYSISNQIMGIMNRLDNIEVNRYESLRTTDFIEHKEISIAERARKLDIRFKTIKYKYTYEEEPKDPMLLIQEINELVTDFQAAKFLEPAYRDESISTLMYMKYNIMHRGKNMDKE